MVGKMLKLKCRLVLDHLKIQPPPKEPLLQEASSSSDYIKEESDTSISNACLLNEPVVKEADADTQDLPSNQIPENVDTVDAQPEPVNETEELDELLSSTAEFKTNVVYSSWKSKGRSSPGGVLEKSQSRFCRLAMKFIKDNNIPPTFETIHSDGTSTSSPSPECGPCPKRLKPDDTDKTDTPSKVVSVAVERKVNDHPAVSNLPCSPKSPLPINETATQPVSSISSDEPDACSTERGNKTIDTTLPRRDDVPAASSSIGFVTPVAPLKVKLEKVDKISFHCPESDVVAQPEEIKEDITGSIMELEQDEISTPKGSRKDRLPKSPDFPLNEHWVKPEDLLEEMWEKKMSLRTLNDRADLFIFPTDSNIVLSPNTWQIPELMTLKHQLNTVKSSLDLYPLNHWHAHTKRMNIANLIMSYVKRYFNPEFTSQAWGKMFEILCSYDVIPQTVLDEVEAIFNNKARVAAKEKVPFDTVHLCEAPGAFISALNHYLKISYSDIDWNWLATTLNPYHENNEVSKMINDDRLILMSMNNWTFLEDKTGNILSNANLEYLIKEKIKKLDNVDEKENSQKSNVLLVTADGSIDCQMNPGEQESMVFHLQFGEIVTALKILEPRGSFILKIFTFLEATTISHLYLLSCVFKEVHLFKPATSKEGNSEVYVVCLDYVGKTAIASILESKLIPSLENYGLLLEAGKLLLPLSSIPEIFIDRIKESAHFFCNYQMKIIRRNMSCFPCDTRMYQVMKPFRKEAAEQWIEWSLIKPLPARYRLFSGGGAEDFKINSAYHVDNKEESGCYAQKLLRQSGSDRQKINEIKMELLSYDNWKSPQNQVVYGSVFKLGPIEFERPYKNIRCSRFCYGRVLTSREEIREILKNYLTDLQSHGLGNMDNICSGHSVKRVYESMNKCCDMHLKDFDVLCFSKLTWDYVTKTDFQHQKDDLNRLFKSIQEMGNDRSMFLCRFPMLTRLQVGIVFCLASVFEKVIIYGDPKKNVVGIMLHKFKGLSQPADKNMFRCFSSVLDVLVDDEFNWPILQVVPMQTVLEFMPTEFLVKYNILLLCQDMLRTIQVAECMIRSNEEATKRYGIMS